MCSHKILQTQYSRLTSCFTFRSSKEPRARTETFRKAESCRLILSFRNSKLFSTGGGGQEVNFTQDSSLVITARVAIGMMPVINAQVTYASEIRSISE